MKYHVLCIMAAPLLAFGSLSAGAEKKAEPAKDPYAELFGFPPKITLDEKQKEKLAELRKEVGGPAPFINGGGFEAQLKWFDGPLNPKAPLQDIQTHKNGRARLARLVARKRNAILTEEQAAVLGMKRLEIPNFATEKALNDPKVWDLSQLEKVFTIQSRDFDPGEQVISLMVITKSKWTDAERSKEPKSWSKVKVIFYDKNDETVGEAGRGWDGTASVPPDIAKHYKYAKPQISRTVTKLTDKQAEEGLMRWRITINLEEMRFKGPFFPPDSAKEKAVVAAKFVFPPLE